ncbi:MAG: hypothetical protein M0C28_39155 [Candidatus Moduliflexus flocculans]|nr:hypothetical protein [Candidatus Moduliflexus flocculans]
MTHGHADENSLVLLMSGGSVLLHDGGYRDYMPSGPYGAYRQDYFHNRLCVRPEKIFWGQKAGEVPLQRPRGRPRPVHARVHAQRRLLPAGPDAEGRLPDLRRLRLQPDPGRRRRLGLPGRPGRRLRQGPGAATSSSTSSRPCARTTSPWARFWHTRQIHRPGRALVRHRLRPHPERPSCPRTSACSSSSRSTEPRDGGRRGGEAPLSGRMARPPVLGPALRARRDLRPGHGPRPARGRGRPQADWAGRISALPAEPSRGATGVAIRAGDREVVVGVKNDLRRDMSRDHRRPRLYVRGGTDPASATSRPTATSPSRSGAATGSTTRSSI